MGEADFACMGIEGLGPRMEAIRGRISPKLEEIGREIAPWLGQRTGHTFFVHVAKHARRTVNPPDDTWVACSEARRGYKMMPHIEIGLFSSCLFVRLGVLGEAREKEAFGRAVARQLEQLEGTTQVFFDHLRPEACALSVLSDPRSEIQSRLRRRQGEAFFGRLWPAAEVAGQDVAALAKDVLAPLLPLYLQAVETPSPATI